MNHLLVIEICDEILEMIKKSGRCKGTVVRIEDYCKEQIEFHLQANARRPIPKGIICPLDDIDYQYR